MARGLASHMAGKVFAIEEPAANFVPADGAAMDLKNVEAPALEIGCFGGSQGTLVVTIEEADTDVNASYTTVALANLEVPRGAFWNANPKTFGFANTGKHWVGYSGGKRFVRITGTGAAGTPNFALTAGVVATRKRHIGGV